MNLLLIIEYLKKFFGSLRYNFIFRIGTCQLECVYSEKNEIRCETSIVRGTFTTIYLIFFCLIFLFVMEQQLFFPLQSG